MVGEFKEFITEDYTSIYDIMIFTSIWLLLTLEQNNKI